MKNVKISLYGLVIMLVSFGLFSCEEDQAQEVTPIEEEQKVDLDAEARDQEVIAKILELGDDIPELSFSESNGRLVSTRRGTLQDGGDEHMFRVRDNCGAFFNMLITVENDDDSRADLDWALFAKKSGSSEFTRKRGWYDMDPGEDRTETLLSGLRDIEFNSGPIYLTVRNDSWFDNRPVDYYIAIGCD